MGSTSSLPKARGGTWLYGVTKVDGKNKTFKKCFKRLHGHWFLIPNLFQKNAKWFCPISWKKCEWLKSTSNSFPPVFPFILLLLPCLGKHLVSKRLLQSTVKFLILQAEVLQRLISNELLTMGVLPQQLHPPKKYIWLSGSWLLHGWFIGNLPPPGGSLKEIFHQHIWGCFQK